MKRSVREAGKLSQQGLGNVSAWDGLGDEAQRAGGGRRLGGKVSAMSRRGTGSAMNCAQPAGGERRRGGKEAQKFNSLKLGTCFVS
jgi:hypothetical protein